MTGDGFFVGGEPAAIQAAATSVHEVAARTGDIGLELLRALAPAAATIAAATVFAPAAAAAAETALLAVVASPGAGLAHVALELEAVAAALVAAGTALALAGTATMVGRGWLGVLGGDQPTVLDAADGVDLRREALSGSWSNGPITTGGALGVRQVRRPDGTTIYVVEATMSLREARSLGFQANGVGGFLDAGTGEETTLRWAVPTVHDAELMLARASGVLIPAVGALAASRLPAPTEATMVRTASAAATGGSPAVPGSMASGAVAGRAEVTTLASGATRFSVTLQGSGSAGILGVAATGGSASARVTVERNPAGAVTAVGLTTATEVDGGRHRNPMVESANREGTLVEREWKVEVTPATHEAAGRIADALARGEAPADADLVAVGGAARQQAFAERTYDVRHQQVSVDIALPPVTGGGSGTLDTAVLRRP